MSQPTMSPIPQERRINFNDQRIGQGFNSQSGLTVGTALERFTTGVDPDAPGQIVDASIDIVDTHEELMHKLGMSFEAQGRYGFVSGGAKVEFADSSTFNSTSTFLVARCIVENPFTSGTGFQTTKRAQELLDVEPGTGRCRGGVRDGLDLHTEVVGSYGQ